MERLQEQNFKRSAEERRIGAFKEPIGYVETYLYPKDQDVIRSRLERLQERTMNYEKWKKGKSLEKEKRRNPPKNIGDLGLDY